MTIYMNKLLNKETKFMVNVHGRCRKSLDFLIVVHFICYTCVFCSEKWVVCHFVKYRISERGI